MVNPNYTDTIRHVNLCGFGNAHLQPPSTVKTHQVSGEVFPHQGQSQTQANVSSSLFSKVFNTICHYLKAFVSFIIGLIKRPTPLTGELDKQIREQQNSLYRNLNVGDWTTGNDVLVTNSAAETNGWKLEFIQQAHHSIEISGSICGGKVFRQALYKIEERLQQCPHLQVRILTTPDLLETKDRKLIERLQKTYPNNFHFLISYAKRGLDLYKVENHVKLMLIDEEYYIIGGTNYQDRLSQETDPNAPKRKGPLLDKILGSGSHDTDVVGKGKALASVMRREFYKLYALLEWKENSKQGLQNHYHPVSSIASVPKFDSYEKREKNVTVKAITGCSETSVNGCTAEYERLIKKRSVKKITIAQMYFDPVQTIKDALAVQSSKADPVSIEVVTAGTQASSPVANQFYAHANANYYSSLMLRNKKNRVFVYNNGKNIFHKKVGVFEREGKEALTAIGSYNWGGKSHKDYEMMVVIKSNKVAEKVLQGIEHDKTKSLEITQKQASQHYHIRNLPKRFWGDVQHSIFPILVG